jgi:hypothetical protein
MWSWVFQTSEWNGVPLDPHAKAVLSALIWHWNNRKGGFVWPSQRRLAEFSGTSPATLNRRLDMLEEIGLIKRVRLPEKQNTRYELLLPFHDLPRKGKRLQQMA